jgi:hypothetical protein
MNRLGLDEKQLEVFQAIKAHHGISSFGGYIHFWSNGDIKLDGDFTQEDLQCIVEISAALRMLKVRSSNG